jgi:N-acetylglutamate synthase-like GNAT family acetyltransferase
MQLQFDFLANHPELVTVLASWFYEEWGRGNPENSFAKVQERLRKRMNRDSLPITLIATFEGKLVGSASIKIREMETHPQFEYWLGAVFVDEAFRGQGFGSEIVQYTVKEAKRLGVEQLYLYTRSHEDFYTHLGWYPFERPQYHGRQVVIMQKSLDI